MEYQSLERRDISDTMVMWLPLFFSLISGGNFCWSVAKGNWVDMSQIIMRNQWMYSSKLKLKCTVCYYKDWHVCWHGSRNELLGISDRPRTLCDMRGWFLPLNFVWSKHAVIVMSSGACHSRKARSRSLEVLLRKMTVCLPSEETNYTRWVKLEEKEQTAKKKSTIIGYNGKPCRLLQPRVCSRFASIQSPDYDAI